MNEVNLVGNVTLYTDSPFNLNKTNKLKGMAFETLIKWTFSKAGIPIDKEIPLNRILREHSIILKKIFLVHKNFSVVYFSKGKKVTFHYHTRGINRIFDTNQLNENVKGIVLSEEGWDGKWYVCSYCGQFILASKKKTRKCRKCGKGYFVRHKVCKKWRFNSLNELISVLLEEEFIKPVFKKKRNDFKKRVDFVRIFYGSVIIYECKNKEKTQVNLSDVLQTLTYAAVLKNLKVPIKYVRLIFNGYYTDSFKESVEWWLKNWGLELKLIPIKKWLYIFTQKTGILLTLIIFSPFPLGKYGFEFIRYGNHSKWYLNIKCKNGKSGNYYFLELVIREKEDEIKKILERR